MIWYPYTQMKTMEDPIQVTDAHGVILETTEGPLIDSISSWWSNDFGYAHPELTAAITGQAEHFSHVMLGGLTHTPVQKLAFPKITDFGVLRNSSNILRGDSFSPCMSRFICSALKKSSMRSAISFIML